MLQHPVVLVNQHLQHPVVLVNQHLQHPVVLVNQNLQHLVVLVNQNLQHPVVLVHQNLQHLVVLVNRDVALKVSTESLSFINNDIMLLTCSLFIIINVSFTCLLLVNLKFIVSLKTTLYN